MRLSSRIPLHWALFALLALAAASSVRAETNRETASLLSAQLPVEVTLKKATIAQTGDALYSATSQRPDLALALLRVAILAKRPPPHHGFLPCPDLIFLLKRTVAAVPTKARQLLELAMSLDPECTAELEKLLEDPTLLGLPADAFSPFAPGGVTAAGGNGFSGSPPGGSTIALPPISSQPAMTPDK